MAYTYDDFIKAANASGRLGRFDENDLQIAQNNPEYGLSMLKLMQDEDDATSDEARLLARTAADQMRKTYGSVQPTIVDPYGDRITGLMQEVGNPAEFTYDRENDPNFQAFKKTYLREGQRAQEETLAKAAAMTGGVPSSYAVTAATQAGNYYAAQLADRVPELEKDAYTKYLNGLAQKQQALENYQKQSATEYARRLEEETLKQQAEKDQNEALLAAQQQKFDNALDLYEKLGYATPEIAAILGVPVGKRVGDAIFDEVNSVIKNTAQGIKGGVQNINAAFWRGSNEAGSKTTDSGQGGTPELNAVDEIEGLIASRSVSADELVGLIEIAFLDKKISSTERRVLINKVQKMQ